MRMEFRLGYIDKSVNVEVPRIHEKYQYKIENGIRSIREFVATKHISVGD
jgi:hypothetical protein